MLTQKLGNLFHKWNKPTIIIYELRSLDYLIQQMFNFYIENGAGLFRNVALNILITIETYTQLISEH